MHDEVSFARVFPFFQRLDEKRKERIYVAFMSIHVPQKREAQDALGSCQKIVLKQDTYGAAFLDRKGKVRRERVTKEGGGREGDGEKIFLVFCCLALSYLALSFLVFVLSSPFPCPYPISSCLASYLALPCVLSCLALRLISLALCLMR